MTRYLATTALAAFALVLLAASPAAAQEVAYVDTDYILERVPEYRTIQQQIDQQAQDWRRELDQREQELEEQFREYQAREVMYTEEERQRRREAIVQTEQELEQDRMRYFGPEGELFEQQETLMRPLQERVLAAVEEVATRDGYDYVLDKSGDTIFLFAREEFDLSDEVLRELGIDVDEDAQ